MKNLLIVILNIFILAASITNAYSASFDCTKTLSKTEKIICGDDGLSQLDDELNKIYQQSIEQSQDKQKEINRQKLWLKNERNVCQDVNCLNTNLPSKNSRNKRLWK